MDKPFEDGSPADKHYHVKEGTYVALEGRVVQVLGEGLYPRVRVQLADGQFAVVDDYQKVQDWEHDQWVVYVP